MSKSLKKSLPMGLACALIAAGYAAFMHYSFEKNWAASLTSVIGTLAVGTILWNWLEPTRKRYAFFWGLIVGLITGWTSLYLGVAGGYAASALADWPSLTVFLQGLIGAIVVTPILIVAYGWISMACCGLIGVALIFYTSRK